MTQLELLFDAIVKRPGAGGIRTVAMGARALTYRLVRARRRTIAIHVERGTIEVRAPRTVPVREVEAFLREKERWVLERLEQTRREPTPFRWSEGELLPVLGRAARLTASANIDNLILEDGILLLPGGQAARWRELGMEWLRDYALDLFHARVRHYAEVIGVNLPSVGLSNARTQWGSCWRRRGDNGRVLLNWRLVHLPPNLIDYVVAHEIAHLKELNHSPRFWAVVEHLYPDFRAARREIGRVGAGLPEL